MKKKICLVIANYYPNISKNLVNGALKILKTNGIKKYKIIKVPGVFEIPFVIARNIYKFDGFLALGCVIKGETPHFDFISRSTFDAIMNLSVNYKKPIGNGLITSLNKRQAFERSSLKKNNKGKEAANALLSILKI